MALPYIFSSGTIIASAQVNANFAACALTDFSNTSNTGSGLNVLGVSPTLVAPALGTPISVTLTNATGLPLTSGVSGILPVLNGGTGTASPNLTQGSGITITGTWPNQTIAATVTTYPGAGIANSTGSAWGTSYSTTGTGTVVALATSASLTTPSIGSGGALFAGSTFTVTLKASASTTGSYTFTLPVSGGTTSGWLLSTDGSGGTSWVAPASGSGLVVGGSLVTGGTSGYVLYNNGGTLGNIQAVTSSSASSVVLRDANANITSNAFYAGTTNAAAAGTTTVLTAASTTNNIVTGSGGQTFQLPSALTLPIGATFTFNNNQSSGAITVNNNSSTLVVSVPSGAFTTVSLLANGNAAGTWDIHASVPSNVSWSTNTLTWTGTIASGTTWNGAAIGTAYGGTGLSGATPFTSGGAVYASSASALTTGTLPVASGGTGTTTSSGASSVVLRDSSANITANALYAASHDLALGTTTANSIHFVVNGGSTDAMTIGTDNVTALTLRPATINSTVGVAQTLANYVAGRQQIYAADYGVVVNSSGAAAANSTIINALMGGISALGGGTLILPFGDVYIASTLDNKYPRVMVLGAGAETFHDSGVTTAADPLYGTRLVATTATTMCKLRTPYAAEQGVAVGNTWKYTGSGFKFLGMNGGAVATAAMLVDSVSFVEVDVFATNFNSSSFFTVQCGVTGTDLGESCDVQFSRLNFRARAIDTTADKAATICTLTGSSNANVSLNRLPLCGINVYAQHWNGNVLTVTSADNNDISVIGVRPGGTGYLAYFKGPTASRPVGGSSNTLMYATGAGSIYAEGTDTGGVTAGVLNRIVHLDNSNGTPAPTAGTGSAWQYFRVLDNVQVGGAYGPIGVSDQPSNAAANAAAIGTESLRIKNTSSNHSRWTDGTNEWALDIDAAQGDFRFIRAAGSGGINLGNGAPAFAYSTLLCIGNNNFGGIGYGTGAGTTGTQATSRTTSIALSAQRNTGALTLFTAAPAVGTPVTFAVTNVSCAATDTVQVSVKSATNTYSAVVTAVGASTFSVTLTSLVGTASDTPVLNFAVLKAVTA